MALVSSSPDDGTIKLLEYAPSRVVPEVRPYSRTVGPSNWMTTPGIAQYLAQRIEAYPHRGIGEFHVHRLDPDDKPLLQQVAALAMQHAIPIHIHSGAEPVRVFFEIEPRLTVIWAHAGLSEPPEVVGPMLDRYDRLYADTSYREHDILNGDGTIDPAWRAIIERHSDRLMVGSDTWVNGQWANYGDIIATNRRWLSQFPRDIAERIAFRNAEALFKRPVRRELIGKK
jgi:predicted TIM-barrel fold metal-dependent hydrolase